MEPSILHCQADSVTEPPGEALRVSILNQPISLFTSFGFCLMYVAPCSYTHTLNCVIFIVGFSLENYQFPSLSL